MRNAGVNVLADIQPAPALAARGAALRTFGGLALVLAVVLLVLGAFLIEDELTNPRASQSLGLFAAALLFASAMALIHELIQLPRNAWRGQADVSSERRKTATELHLYDRHIPCPAKPRPARSRVEQRRNLPYQRSYVDRVRVRA